MACGDRQRVVHGAADGHRRARPDGYDDGIRSYAWNFGDGTTGTGQTASRTYGAHGTYSVTLTVTDTDDETDSATRSVPVNRAPTARFTVVCNGLSCGFDASGSTDDNEIKSYNWTGATGTGARATRTYSGPGNYTVGLEVTDNDGESDSTSRTFGASRPPVARFSVSCSERQCLFDARGSTDDVGIRSYSWDLGVTSASGSLVSHEFDADGTYEILLAVTDTHDNTTFATESVTVDGGETGGPRSPNAAPAADFTTACTGLACTFTSTSTDDVGIVSYEWSTGDGAAEGTKAVHDHRYGAAGRYTVQLTVRDARGALAVAAYQVRVSDP